MSFQKTTIKDPQGRAVSVEIIPVNAAQEPAATYLLADGTTLSLRNVVVQVLRVPGQYDAEGNPVYVVRSQNIVVAQSPENIRQTEK